MTALRSLFCAAALLSAAGAFAQHEAQATCTGAGPEGVEPLDRAGRVLQVNDYRCEIRGGPFDGAVMSGTNLWEITPGTARFLGGHGVIRRADGAAVYEETEGALRLKLRDGQVIGWESTGAGVYKMASGRVAPFQGRRYAFHATASGAHAFGARMLIADD
jgi:PAS domain-containing protein